MFVAWLSGALLLADRRSGLVLMLLGGILGCLMPLAHMRSKGLVGGRVAGTDDVLFFAWTLVALGVTAPMSVLLAARGLWITKKVRISL